MRWSSWGGATAKASGTDYANSPTSGRSAVNPVRVTLKDRRHCGTRLVYATVEIRYTRGVPYNSYRHVMRFPFGCPS